MSHQNCSIVFEYELVFNKSVSSVFDMAQPNISKVDRTGVEPLYECDTNNENVNCYYSYLCN